MALLDDVVGTGETGVLPDEVVFVRGKVVVTGIGLVSCLGSVLAFIALSNTPNSSPYLTMATSK